LKTTKIIWIEEEDDEELSSLASISFKEAAEASFIITNKGRILKDRNGLIVNTASIPSFELVKQTGKIKENTRLSTKRFRLIDDPIDINYIDINYE
jgi:hypothetical protein